VSGAPLHLLVSPNEERETVQQGFEKPPREFLGLNILGQGGRRSVQDTTLAALMMQLP
jgi:hypothetical protein